MYGGGGSDILDGARNDDELHGGANPLPPTTELEERLYGQTGDDKLYGEDGPDDILGQQGTDLMSGGAGDDTIDAVDAETVDNPDTVRCAGGFDTVFVSDNDLVSDDCEVVN